MFFIPSYTESTCLWVFLYVRDHLYSQKYITFIWFHSLSFNHVLNIYNFSTFECFLSLKCLSKGFEICVCLCVCMYVCMYGFSGPPIQVAPTSERWKNGENVDYEGSKGWKPKNTIHKRSWNLSYTNAQRPPLS